MAMTQAASSLQSTVRCGGSDGGWWLGRALRNLHSIFRTNTSVSS
jgi:hypothetical protein